MWVVKITSVVLLPIVVALVVVVTLWALHRAKRLHIFTFYEHTVAAVSLLSFILYPSITRSILQMFSCHQIRGRSYLIADVDENCFQGRHLALALGMGVPCVLLYVIGMPLAALAMLWRNKGRLHSRRTLFKLGIFYVGYSESQWYWEAAVVLRKTLVALASILMFEDPTMQVFLVCLLLSCAIGAQSYARPYLHHLVLITRKQGMPLDVAEGSMSSTWHGRHRRQVPLHRGTQLDVPPSISSAGGKDLSPTCEIK